MTSYKTATTYSSTCLAHVGVTVLYVYQQNMTYINVHVYTNLEFKECTISSVYYSLCTFRPRYLYYIYL